MPSFTHPIFNLTIIVMLSIVYVYPIYCRNGLYYRQLTDKNANFLFYYIIVSVFCVFSFSNGDFFNYYDGFKILVSTQKNSHFEPVYVWIGNHLTNSYLVWRLIIWGSATFITMIAFLRLKLPVIPSYAALTICYLTTLYIMRGNLGVAILFYGLTFLYYPLSKKKRFSYILGALFIIVSYFFHKSMLLSIGLLVPSIFFNFSRKRMLISFLLFPISVIAMKIALDYMGRFGLDFGNEELSSYSKRYALKENIGYNFNGLIAIVFTYGGILYTIYYAYKTRLIESLPAFYKVIFNYWYIYVYMAFVCYFQSTGGWYFTRFLYMSTLPWAIILAYIYTYIPNDIKIKRLTLLSFLGALYPILYAVYKY